MTKESVVPASPRNGNGNGAARRRRLLALFAVLGVAGVGAFIYWLHARNYESTDDAFITADIVQISPKVPGTVIAVHVRDNQPVKVGDPLVDLDPRDYQVQVDQARANLAAAQAEVERARPDLARFRDLYRRHLVSEQLLDQAEAAARTAAAKVAQAQARLAQAELNLSYTKIVAPQAGRVSKKNVLPGAQVQVGTALMAIVADQPWVVANYKETQLTRMKVGQPVTFRVDTYPGVIFTGHVDSFQAGTGAVFSLLPPENATGNYVKVVQRVPVKLVFDSMPDAAHQLVPGMSVVPTVEVGAAPRSTTRTAAR